jgi:hypothetical protein
MKHVGLGLLLRFVDNEDNPDFDDEFIQLMSHPDTHAAYNRAYRIWKADEDGTKIFDGSEDQNTKAAERRRIDDYELGRYQSVDT